jgi:acyl carrier protein
LESGILNSLGILQIVAYVEDNLDLDIPSEDVVYENFHSVSALATYLDNLEE